MIRQPLARAALATACALASMLVLRRAVGGGTEAGRPIRQHKGLGGEEGWCQELRQGAQPVSAHGRTAGGFRACDFEWRARTARGPRLAALPRPPLHHALHRVVQLAALAGEFILRAAPAGARRASWGAACMGRGLEPRPHAARLARTSCRARRCLSRAGALPRMGASRDLVPAGTTRAQQRDAPAPLRSSRPLQRPPTPQPRVAKAYVAIITCLELDEDHSGPLWVKRGCRGGHGSPLLGQRCRM
jgi:hypothetical protein